MVSSCTVQFGPMPCSIGVHRLSSPDGEEGGGEDVEPLAGKGMLLGGYSGGVTAGLGDRDLGCAGCITPGAQTAAGAIRYHDTENKVIYSAVREEVILHGL